MRASLYLGATERATRRNRSRTPGASAARTVRTGGKLVGNVVWVVTTSMLLIGLPLALSLEDEAMRSAQEKEMLAQQQGAQQVPYPIPISASHSSCARPPFADGNSRSTQMMPAGSSYPASGGGQPGQQQKAIVPPGF